MSKELAMFPCPPLRDYPEQPKDQSLCSLFDCPSCKQQMWLSEKKKGALMFCAAIKKPIVLACYDCMTKMAEQDRALILDATKLEL